MRLSLEDEMNNPKLMIDPYDHSRADDELVAAAKNGDECAFEVLVKRYRARIFAIALRYTRIREDAEDIVQQTFQKAFIYLNKFRGKSAFLTWLTRIAINEALMFRRRTRSVCKVSIDEPCDKDEVSGHREIPDSAPNPELRYLQWEAAHMLSSAIAQLKPRLRVAMELKELRELSGPDTARRMGVSISAVKARLLHGRRKLREILRRSTASSRRPERATLHRMGNGGRISQNA